MSLVTRTSLLGLKTRTTKKGRKRRGLRKRILRVVLKCLKT